MKLLGTPAEEHGGGKVSLLEAGAFEDTHLSLMVHGMTSTPEMTGDSHSARSMNSTAVDRFEVIYTGLTAHAAGMPEMGINASNAAILALNAFAMLRQHLPKEVNLNAFVSHGGEATNIIPDRTVVQVETRAYDLGIWRDMKKKVLRCFEAGAVATGCSWEWRPTEHPYAPLLHDDILADLWDKNFEARGRVLDYTEHLGGGSTDMGNVSLVVPSIHPLLTFRGKQAPAHNPRIHRDRGQRRGRRGHPRRRGHHGRHRDRRRAHARAARRLPGPQGRPPRRGHPGQVLRLTRTLGPPAPSEKRSS